MISFYTSHYLIYKSIDNQSVRKSIKIKELKSLTEFFLCWQKQINKLHKFASNQRSIAIYLPSYFEIFEGRTDFPCFSMAISNQTCISQGKKENT